MLIPSVDLMSGKVVQLVQGKNKALEFDNFAEWIARFSGFPLVQLIDLDAAMGGIPNAGLVKLFANQLPCQIGGGIRSVEAARQTLSLGARRLIVGSSLIRNGAINTNFARHLAAEFGPERLVFALDAKRGKVAIRGWKEITAISPLEMMRELEPCCGAFLYTHIDTEGMMTGLPLEPVRQLRDATQKQLIVAGGITSQEEIDRLHAIKVDAVVGMALYLGRLKLPDNIALSR